MESTQLSAPIPTDYDSLDGGEKVRLELTLGVKKVKYEHNSCSGYNVEVFFEGKVPLFT